MRNFNATGDDAAGILPHVQDDALHAGIFKVGNHRFEFVAGVLAEVGNFHVTEAIINHLAGDRLNVNVLACQVVNHIFRAFAVNQQFNVRADLPANFHCDFAGGNLLNRCAINC